MAPRNSPGRKASGMLFAVWRCPPVFGGKVSKVDSADTLKIVGVVPSSKFHPA